MGLSIGRIPVSALVQRGRGYDPAASSWFAAVEATGATFGPTANTAAVNKKLINDQLFVGLKNDGIDITTFNYAALRVGPTTLAGAQVSIVGSPTFNNIVSGDYNRLSGIKYGNTKSTNSNVNQSTLAQNNQHVFMYVTEPTDYSIVTIPAFWGPAALTGGRNTAISASDALVTRGVTNGTSQGLAYTPAAGCRAVSRINASEYIRKVGTVNDIVAAASEAQVNSTISFNCFTSGTNFGTSRSAWESIGRGLTTTELNALNTRIQAVLTGLV